MADQPYTNQNQNNDQEQELLKEADIVVRNQDGSFSVISGKDLLRQEGKREPEEKEIYLKEPPLSVKPSTTPVDTKSAGQPIPKLRVVLRRPIPKKESLSAVGPSQIKQTTVSISAPAIRLEKPRGEAGKASFFFDAEDEREIQKIKDGQEVKADIDLNTIIDGIIAKTNISFGDEAITRRFRSQVASRLKDVRTHTQFLENLQTNPKIGGLGLNEAQANTVAELVEEELAKIQDRRVKPPQTEDVQEKRGEEEQEKREELAAVREMIAQKQEQATATTAKIVAKTVPASPVEKPLTPRQFRPESRPEPLQPKLREKPKIFVFPKVKRQVKDGTRTRIADIKTPPRVLGPVEELRTLNLSEFRQLGSSPETCTQKVEEKIILLEEDSLIKKAEGIRAWKQSEIYQLYLDIGNDSMAQGKSVKEIIESRSLEGKQTLSEEEFNAVADLNKRLRF